MSFETIKLRRELEEIISAAVAENEREDAAAKQAFEAAIKAPLEAEIARLRDRLSTIVDEAFGPQEALGMDALLSRLEYLLTESARQHEEVRRERDAARADANRHLVVLDELRSELWRTRDRCRTAAQILIAEIGASGPESIEETARRAVAMLQGERGQKKSDLLQDLAAAHVALRDLIDACERASHVPIPVVAAIAAARAELGGQS